MMKSIIIRIAVCCAGAQGAVAVQLQPAVLLNAAVEVADALRGAHEAPRGLTLACSCMSTLEHAVLVGVVDLVGLDVLDVRVELVSVLMTSSFSLWKA